MESIQDKEKRKKFREEMRVLNQVSEEYVDTSDLDTCSAMDCTGLMPTPPLTDAELESYDELYHLFPKVPSGKV